MKKNILLLCIITMIVLMIFTNTDHIFWIINNTNDQRNWTEKIFPLLINNIVFIPIISLFLIWKSKPNISTSLLYLTIATVSIQIATTVYAHMANDPLAAGMPFVIVTIPVSVLLIIFSIKELIAQ